MSFTKTDYDDFCENICTVNAVYDEVHEARQKLYQYASRELKSIFRKHLGLSPQNVHFAKDGSSIEIMYNVDDFNGSKLPLNKELVEDVHMPVQVKLLDTNRLVFVLLPEVNGGVE